MNLVFAGTPEFAATILRGLLQSRHRILAVLTQPDRPAGRGKSLRASPVKCLAEATGHSVLQPASLRDAQTSKQLSAAGADAMVVAAYGLILPRAILELFPSGCINVHASLLPRWRGAAPIQRAILAGDSRTGVSIMRMTEGLDRGDVYLRRACEISESETAGSLHERLAQMGSRALLEALEGIDRGVLVPLPQDHAQATYAEKISKNEARLDWSQCAARLARCVRAFHPWPVAYTHLGSPGPRSRIRIHAAQPSPSGGPATPGTVTAVGPDFIEVACGSGNLRLRALQRPGKQVVEAAQFLRGTPVEVGERLQ